MNADNVLKIMIELGVVGEADVTAANDLLKESTANLNREMGVIAVTQEAVKNATQKSGNEVKAASQKWVEFRQEARQAGNELGRVAGLSNAGDLIFTKNAAAISVATKAIEFFKDTWTDIQSAIKGPVQVGLPDAAPAHISAAAEAWQAYAEARTKAMAGASGPEADGQAQAKRLNTELGLMKQVLAAEREKATADLEQHKSSLTPEVYAAAKENLDQVFTRAGTAAEQDNRRKLIANKDREAANLEIDAKAKTADAMGIKAAPAAVAALNQKTLDENAAAAAIAKKQIVENIQRLDRIGHPDNVHYEGLDGKVQQLRDNWDFRKRYGYGTNMADARKLEETRLTQAQAQMDLADNYRSRQAAAADKRKNLMDEAGTESGKAAILRREVQTDTAAETAQNAVNERVAQLHLSASRNMQTASKETIASVQAFMSATLGGYAELRAVMNQNQRELEALRRQTQSHHNNNR